MPVKAGCVKSLTFSGVSKIEELVDVSETHIHWVLISPLPFSKGKLLDEFTTSWF